MQLNCIFQESIFSNPLPLSSVQETLRPTQKQIPKKHAQKPHEPSHLWVIDLEERLAETAQELEDKMNRLFQERAESEIAEIFTKSIQNHRYFRLWRLHLIEQIPRFGDVRLQEQLIRLAAQDPSDEMRNHLRRVMHDNRIQLDRQTRIDILMSLAQRP